MAERAKLFTERLQERLVEALDPILREFPELDGAAVCFVWNRALGDVTLKQLAFGAFDNDPSMLFRTASALAHATENMVGRAARDLHEAAQMRTRLQQELDDLGKQGAPSADKETTPD